MKTWLHMLVLLVAVSTAAAETRVRVTGMRSKSEAQVLDLMGGRLAHVQESPASPALADDAAFILRRLLRNDGYMVAEVNWRITGKNEITLTVSEGMRQSLGKVTVTGAGNSEDTRRFERLYASPAEKNRPFGLGDPPFREEDVDKGLSFILQELNARGHWNAEVAITRRQMNPNTGAIDLDIAVQPGPLYRIGTPRVTSVDGRGVKLTGGAVSPFAGRPATTGQLNAMRLAAEELAVSRGYPNAVIFMGRALEGVEFIPEFQVDLGQRVRLNDLRFTGLEITQPGRLEQRLGWMRGDWYDEALMNKRLREFLGTGAFESARIETTPAGHRLVDATLHFEETRAREVSVAVGYGSYDEFLARVTYANRNFLGRLWGLSSGIQVGSRGLLGDVRVTNPWVRGRDISATARVFALVYDREGYRTYEAGGSLGMNWKPADHYSLDLTATLSAANLTSDGLPKAELGETVYAHPRLRLTQKLDHRDSSVLPKSGWHLEWPLEIGAALGDSATTYLMAGLSGGWYGDLGRKYEIGIGGAWQMLVPSGDSSDLPIDLRLFNGGPRSVRSFPERELGSSVKGYPTGGESIWHVNTEIIRKITDSFKAVAFVDAGALSRHYEDFASADIEVAAGLGLRFDLPIGPVRLEYGYNLTRDSGEPVGTLHFAIGMAY
jgi:outer membrane protein insertion porin family